MRILFIDFTLPFLLADSNYPVGGWAIELNAWIKGLRANGHQVGVLTWKRANRFVKRGVDFELIETYDPNKGIKILKYFYAYIPTLFTAAYRYRPHVIVQACAGLDTGIMALLAARLKVPFIHRIASNVDTDNGYKNKLFKYEQIAFRYGLRRTNAILCQNGYQFENLRKKYPNKPIFILPNPFMNTVAADIPLLSRAERKYVAWLGVFKKPKNLPLLYMVAQKMPSIEFRIAGMIDSNADNDTREALSGLEKLPNVRFVGYLTRNRVHHFLSKAFALLNTSFYEGFSNTFLEAFSVGTPVIAPSRVDPNKIIQKNRLGFSVKDDIDFPIFIKELCEVEASFSEMSIRCRAYLNNNHDPIKLAKLFSKIVSEIC